jgi:hypothetical protein
LPTDLGGFLSRVIARLCFALSTAACLLASTPAWAACTALSGGVVPFVRFNSANNATYFSESTATATALIQGAIVYDTANSLLKVCDGTSWQSLGGGGGASQWTNGTSGAIYYNGGNVGIGTSAPAEKLTISGVSLYNSGLKLTGSGTGGVGLSLENTASSGKKFAIFSTGASNAPGIGKLAIYDDTTGAYRFILDGSGNVGIGVTSPGQRLDVQDAVNSQNFGVARFYQTSSALAYGAGILVRSDDSSQFAQSRIGFQNATGSIVASVGSANATYSNSSYPALVPNSLTLYSANSVGIVADNASAAIRFAVGNGASSVKQIITAAGNVGIGTTNPDQGKLEVKGGTVCVDTDSDDNATSCIANESDARLKANVRPLDLSLDSFMKLRPVSFDWKHDDPEVLKHYPLIGRFAAHPHSIGLIAQEVQALVPEAIEPEAVGDKEVQYLQLDYTKLVPVVIKAVQDMKHLFEGRDQQVSAEIEALKAENAALKQRLEVLEKIILTPEARAAAEAK